MTEEKGTKVSFNSRVLSATGVSLAALFIIVAGNAKALFDGLSGLPAFITALATGLPLGVGSYLIAQLLGPFIYLFLTRWLPESKNNAHRKDFLCEAFTLLTCVLICVAQAWTAGAGTVLLAGLLGTLAGFSSPFFTRLFRATGKDA